MRRRAQAARGQLADQRFKQRGLAAAGPADHAEEVGACAGRLCFHAGFLR
jgi:hypothetical protein